ncbi:MAG: 2-hydroxyacid dehydrogenase [Salibacteraceae bacterium]
MKIVCADKVHPILINTLCDAGFDVAELWDADEAILLSELRQADGLVLRSRFVVDKELMNRAPRLRLIGRVGSGLEHIDLHEAEKRGIVVLSSPEGNRQAVGEHALGMVLSLFKRIAAAHAQVRSKQWIRSENEGVELNGKTVGIIGFGNTGSAFAQVLKGFDVEILAYDKYKAEYPFATGLEEIYRKADILSLHLPLNSETQHWLDKVRLERFSNPIYVVNTARGGLVDTSALLWGLKSGRILGACLDVLEYEDETLKMMPFDELPAEAIELINHRNVIITPHIAGLTAQSKYKLSKVLADKIIEWHRTQPEKNTHS